MALEAIDRNSAPAIIGVAASTMTFSLVVERYRALQHITTDIIKSTLLVMMNVWTIAGSDRLDRRLRGQYSDLRAGWFRTTFFIAIW